VIPQRRLLLIFRIVVGGVFVWAGVQKIIDPLGFAQNVENFRVVSRELAFLVAVVLPWVEVLSGAFLISGILLRSSALLISIQLIVFIGLVASVLARGIDTSCGCFGSLSRRADLTLILTDAVLLILALVVLLARPARKAH
jgi:uncharacterized membrane protein YphA (DoxX/SURF4 family)